MSWPYLLVVAVIVLLLCLAFRRKRVADEVQEFLTINSAQHYIRLQDARGYDCWLEQISTSPERWQVRCYRRKERSE